MKNKLITQAKKNFRDYRIVSQFTAGMVLTGSEIKSLRNHQVSINEAYILPQQKELYVLNMTISPYQHSLASDSRRKRKLLLKRKEINQIIQQLKTKNYVLVPLQLFINQQGWAKLEIALSQRLRKYQIKEKIKEKEIKKKIREEDF